MTPDAATIRKELDRVRIVAIIDGIALIALLICAATDQEGIINVLGPIHGVGFLILLYLTGKGAGEGRWGWWFPAVTLVTTGPPGSIYGHIRISRALDAAQQRP
ncbi:DUF3817 domain-containing protein [Conexibacter sp. SYSU D00693]|uniref:DUF3817 domain-containing protein n=1 Tax=Conexibacter sp. SYSU D00693 TaxID=2812560 RepID=UPI00196AB5FB|nr:DUF3817 domain-containing protein [Conexibacter sp. SYSU D00693]